MAGELNSQESRNIGAMPARRRSLAAFPLPADVMNQPQAEDLSRTGRQLGQFTVRDDQCQQTVMSVQRPRAGETQHQSFSAVDSGRPLSRSTDSRNLFTAEEDIDSWLSESVIMASKSRNVPLNRITPAQSFDRRASYSETLPSASRSAVGSSASEVWNLNPETVQGGRNTFSAGQDPSRSATVFAPPVANLGLKNGGMKEKSLPPRRSLDSLSRMSLNMFSSVTPVLSTEMRLRRLGGLWPTPARTLAEPSPVATVIPQVQVAVGKPGSHPAEDEVDPMDTVGGAEATSTSMESAPAQTRRRKRKRRSLFGSRRQTKKSQRTKTAQPDVGNNPTLNIAKPNQDAEVPVAGARMSDTADLEATTNSLLACSLKSSNQVSTNTPRDKSANTASVAGARRALKPIENQRRGQFFTSASRDIHKPRSIPIGSWLQTRTPGSGRKAHMMMSYVKRQQSSHGVQKVPTASPQSDIFEFCGDEDEIGPGGYRPTTSCFRGTSSWSTQFNTQPTPAVASAYQKPGPFTDRLAGNTSR